jgi:hypothetical protein
MTDKPRRATTPARSASKSARKPGQPYDAEAKAKALAVLEAEGMAEAHRRTKVPKATLSRWAKAAGVDLEGAAQDRTRAAAATVRARAAEVTVGTVAQLEAHVAQAGDLLATVAGVNALAARLIAQVDPAKVKRVANLGGFDYLVDDPDVDEVLRVAGAIGTLPLAVRDAEGILTRAIHDLQLLKGEATERGELVVEFSVPRPQPLDPASVPTYDTQE